MLIKIGWKFLDKDLDSARLFINELNQLATSIDHKPGMAESTVLFGQIEYISGNYEAALNLYQKALIQYREQRNNIQVFQVLRDIGLVYRFYGDPMKSLEYYDQAKVIATEHNLQDDLAFLYNTYAIFYHERDNYDKAADFYFRAIEIAEKNNLRSLRGSCLNNLGMLHVRQGEFDVALEYFEQAVGIYEELDQLIDLSTTFSNMGLVYRGLKLYDKAIFHLDKALEIQKKNNSKNQIAITYNGYGEVYQAQQKYDVALEYYQKALAIREEIDNTSGKIYQLNAIADIYLLKKNYHKAIVHGQGALALSKEVKSLVNAKDAAGTLAQSYFGLKDFLKAYEYLELHKKYNDSIYNEQKSEQISNLRLTYETDKKEQEIKLLSQTKEMQQAEISQQKQLTIIAVGVFLLLGVLGFVIFRYYRLNQQKRQLQLTSDLEKEQLEAERLQELDRAKSRFFANIAHEFRTPLTLISGPSEQILNRTKETKTKENVGLIKKNADRLLQLINQLLDLSKLESGMIKLNTTPTDLINFVKVCTESFESLADENDIAIRFNSKLKRLESTIDPEKFSIVLNNLMVNAIKFTPPFGKITVDLHEIVNDENSKQIRISVKDSGIGIGEDQLPYIFDRFYQVDDSLTRKTQGTGIGLALTKELVELHEGTISVLSTPGAGTQFDILLPITQHKNVIVQPGSELQKESLKTEPGDSWEDRQILEQQNDLSGATKPNRRDELKEQVVLVVEDNPDVRKFIVDSVGNSYQTIEAENGRIGLEVATEQVPDLIISDVMMPEMDGFEFCKKSKQDNRTSHIPVILLTAKAGVDNKIEGLETGADDYLAKPFNTRELLTRIKNLISIRQQLQLKYAETRDVEVLPNKENQFITRLKEIIAQHLDEEQFSMDDLGKEMGMSRTQIHRKLKALTNKSTSHFIRVFRLEKAMSLLKNEDYNISEVAYMVGFSTPAYFSTCFTEQYGYAPSEVKNQSVS